MDNTYNRRSTDSERRNTTWPRRLLTKRRYRTRSESLISDCRTRTYRRYEDEEGLTEVSYLESYKAIIEN